MQLRKKLAENLRSIRKSKHWTQDKLARICKINKTNIGYIEQERISTSIDTLDKISKALDTDPCILCAANTISFNKGDLAFCFWGDEGMEYYPISSNLKDSISFLTSFLKSNNISQDFVIEKLKNINIPYDYYVT